MDGEDGSGVWNVREAFISLSSLRHSFMDGMSEVRALQVMNGMEKHVSIHLAVVATEHLHTSETEKKESRTEVGAGSDGVCSSNPEEKQKRQSFLVLKARITNQPTPTEDHRPPEKSRSRLACRTPS